MSLSRFIPFQNPDWEYWLTHKYISDTFVEDAFSCSFLAGMGTSCFNGIIHGYFNCDSFLTIPRYVVGHTMMNTCASMLPSGALMWMGPLSGNYNFIDAGLLLAPILSNLAGLLSSQIIGYKIDSVNSNIAINPALSSTGINVLTCVEAAALSAWTEYHLYRVFNEKKINTLESMHQKKIKEDKVYFIEEKTRTTKKKR